MPGIPIRPSLITRPSQRCRLFCSGVASGRENVWQGWGGSSSRVAKNNSIQFTFRVEQGDSAVKPWLLTCQKWSHKRTGDPIPTPGWADHEESVLGWVCKVPQFQRTWPHINSTENNQACEETTVWRTVKRPGMFNLEKRVFCGDSRMENSISDSCFIN